MGNRGTFGTPRRRAAFIAAIASGTMTVEQAAASIGAGRRSVYRWRQEDEEFRQAWNDAVEESADLLEAMLHELALGGDVQALIFLLRSRKPEIYNPTLVLRQQMLQLALAKARAEAVSVPTIESHAERPMIYPAEARHQLEVPKLLSGRVSEADDMMEEEDAA
jgi:hypothetical protein